MRKYILVFLLLLGAFIVKAQDSAVASFNFSQKRINDSSVSFITSAHIIKPGVQLFALKKSPEDAVFSQVAFDSSIKKYIADTLIVEKGNITTQMDTNLQVNVNTVSDSVQWIQTLQLPASDSARVKGLITYMYKIGDEYLTGEQKINYEIKSVAFAKNNTGGAEANNVGKEQSRSLLWVFLAAFAGGLLALLTPCVYSMIPVTVSFFTKRSKTKSEGIKNAIFYSLSIIIIFTLLGFLITVIFGPAALNNLATNWIANLVFFTLFLLFGISFLGAFEIELPSSWSTKADSKAGTGNFLGIFFMALTLVIVSFSCTGPIIGNLLVIAAKGNYYGPLVGMFGFSLALSLPFALFAFFPSKLNAWGKAGGWLNAIKVTLGFLELALALKFLSNADLAKNWRILDREVFIVLWVVIFFLLGLYLIGKLKFRHDDELPKNDFGQPFLTVTRLFFAIASFAIAAYLVPGLWGAPLKGFSAFIPPMGTQDFNADDLPSGYKLSQNAEQADSTTTTTYPEPKKYAAIMKKNEPDVVVNNGLVTYFDYNEALEVARKLKKPLMLDFTGVNCINCRKMEGQVWSDPDIMQRLKNDFVIASLFVDVHNGVDIPDDEKYYSKNLGKQIETLGDLNADIQVTRFEANTQPFYFFLDQNEQRLAPVGYPYDPDVEKFKKHLDNVVAAYKKKNNL